MTVSSGFFNSVSGDRKYDAVEMAKIFDGIIEDGVHKGIGTEFAVTATGGLSLNVGAGRSWFNHVWLLNDAPFPTNAAASNVALPRIDAIVLEIDSSLAIRAANIKYKQGIAASTPNQPAMTHTETLNEYPVAFISRPANSTTIIQSQITNVVGTPACPYATSRLLDRSFEPSWMHRDVFRGKHLGNAYTPAQKAAVENGSFDDLYVGDYWEINGVKWRIADMNYYKGRGPVVFAPLPNPRDDRVSRNHLVVIPDRSLIMEKMYADRATNNWAGYWGSRKVQAMNLCKPIIEAAFGALDGPNFVTWWDYYSPSSSNGRPSAVQWFSSRLEIPNAAMITGAPWFMPTSNGPELPPYYQTTSHIHLPLFRIAPWFNISDAADNNLGHYWLRDMTSAQTFAIMSPAGDVTFSFSDNGPYGFRPYFLLG